MPHTQTLATPYQHTKPEAEALCRRFNRKAKLSPTAPDAWRAEPIENSVRFIGNIRDYMQPPIKVYDWYIVTRTLLS
jgi:hypothetical protein